MELCLLKQALQGVESLVIGQEKKFELIWWIFQQVQIFSRLLKMAQPSSWSAMAERSQGWADQQTSEKLWSAISQLKSSGMDGYGQQRLVANELHEERESAPLQPPILWLAVLQRAYVNKVRCIPCGDCHPCSAKHTSTKFKSAESVIAFLMISSECNRAIQVKAKAIRKYVDKIITLAKKGDIHARRQVNPAATVCPQSFQIKFCASKPILCCSSLDVGDASALRC